MVIPENTARTTKVLKVTLLVLASIVLVAGCRQQARLTEAEAILTRVAPHFDTTETAIFQINSTIEQDLTQEARPTATFRPTRTPIPTDTPIPPTETPTSTITNTPTITLTPSDTPTLTPEQRDEKLRETAAARFFIAQTLTATLATPTLTPHSERTVQAYETAFAAGTPPPENVVIQARKG